MNNKNNNSSAGLGVGGVIGIVFIVLKLIGVINWSWLWVLSPFWISWALLILVIIGAFCYYKWSENRWK